MNSQKYFLITLLTGACLWAQTRETAPIFRATVIERTTKAINYRYRAEPTAVDFSGTVLMPKARGTAFVTSKPGRTEIEASFERLTPPTPYGPEYLTYVLWSLSPDGRPQNLGEIITNGRDKAKVRVSTDLQAFAMIVTAEPYASVRKPSDVVVLENKVRPDTLGIISQVNARYELLPRGHYVLERFDDSTSRAAEGARLVSAREYEVQLEIYEAQNAVNIARTTARAGEFAPEVLTRAESLLQDARAMHRAKGDRTRILQLAREATHTAEDARLVALSRAQQQAESNLKAELRANRQAQINAESDAAKARAEREAARAQLEHTQAAMQNVQRQAQAEVEAERARRLRAEAEMRALEEQQAAARGQARAIEAKRTAQKTLRARLYADLNANLRSLDTPRGLVVVLRDDGFSGSRLRPDVQARTRRIASILAPYSGLSVTVEGHSDSTATEMEARLRAEEVVASLRSAGIAASAQMIGDRRRIGPSAAENRRVEIVIQGDPIGGTAVWDQPYSISSNR
jgi:flagellar motor protein MotB